MSAANTDARFISSTGFSSQCFPVRSLTRYKRQDDEGKCLAFLEHAKWCFLMYFVWLNITIRL